MIGKRVHAQNFDVGFEKTVVGEKQREREDVVRFIRVTHDHADAPAAEVDGVLCETAFCGVCLGLNADRQGHIDSKMRAAISTGRRRIRSLGCVG